MIRNAVTRAGVSHRDFPKASCGSRNGRLATDDESVPDSWYDGHVDRIRGEIHERHNRVRRAMNDALVGIGIRNAALREKALAGVTAIGAVDVDYGATGCERPDAATHIAIALARKR